jgi:hypothetical protein
VPVLPAYRPCCVTTKVALPTFTCAWRCWLTPVFPETLKRIVAFPVPLFALVIVSHAAVELADQEQEGTEAVTWKLPVPLLNVNIWLRGATEKEHADWVNCTVLPAAVITATGADTLARLRAKPDHDSLLLLFQKPWGQDSLPGHLNGQDHVEAGTPMKWRASDHASASGYDKLQGQGAKERTR